MRRDSSLTVEQRAAAIELFGDGWARKAVATRLGASVWAVGELYDRWRLRGGAALVSKPTKRAFSFEFKLKAVQRSSLVRPSSIWLVSSICPRRS